MFSVLLESCFPYSFFFHPQVAQASDGWWVVDCVWLVMVVDLLISVFIYLFDYVYIHLFVYLYSPNIAKRYGFLTYL